MNGARVSSIKVSALSHATENDERVVKAILQVCPEGYPRKITSVRVKGHYGNEIVVYRINVKGAAKAEAFFTRLWSHISSRDRGEILSRIGTLMEPSGALHIRFDKQESYKGGTVLHDSDPIKVEVQFAARGVSGDLLLERIGKRMNSSLGSSA